MPSADCHSALYSRHDRPRPDVAQRLPRVVLSAPFPRSGGVAGPLRAPRGAQLHPLAQQRPQHLALRRHCLLCRALPQGQLRELYIYDTVWL